MVIEFRCPADHIVIHDTDDEECPTCISCDIVATHYSSSPPEVYTWTPAHVHEAQCRALQDAMDAAFDHQYFLD
jgi:hypothetical protein